MAEAVTHEVTHAWSEFDPTAYLAEYYADIGAENVALLRFLSESCQDLPAGGLLLDFGGGPTIYGLISAAARVDEIHFADYLDANLREVKRWIDDEPGAFDWNGFIAKALELEAGSPASEAAVEQRASEIRKRTTRIMHCDASRNPPIDGSAGSYDIVQSHFCAESATSDRWQWQAYMGNIISLLRPGGRLIMSALEGASSYAVGSRHFPAVEIDEDDVVELLEDNGFPRKRIEVFCVPADRPTRDYKGFLLAVATKGLEDEGSSD